MIKTFFFTSFLIASTSAIALDIGSVPPALTIQGEEGGKVDDTPWNSSTLTGKVHMLFYVDPDEKGINEALEKRLDKENFDRAKFGSVAVINQKATWLPNVAIDSSLASKQKEFPYTVYVRDKVSKLVKDWKLKNDAYVVVLLNKEGKVLYKKDGTLATNDIEEVVKLIKDNM